MFVEPLEFRCLMSTAQGHDTLNIVGTGGNDHIVIAAAYSKGWKFRVTINNDAPKDYYLYKFSHIVINGGAGNDYIEADLGLPYLPNVGVKLLGGGGNDTLVGGSENDTLNGGAGADLLFGNGGSDSLAGGPGSDIVAGGDGQDLFEGGPGEILVDYSIGDRDVLRHSAKARFVTGTLVNGLTGESTGYRLDDIPAFGSLDLQFKGADMKASADALAGQPVRVRGKIVIINYADRGSAATLVVQNILPGSKGTT